MPRTQLQIVQGAFAAMVGGGLTGVDDPNAGPIRLVYDSIVDDALLHEAWPWTLARVPLSNKDPAPDQPEAFRFTMPDALLTPLGQPVAGRERLSVGPRAVYDAEGASQPTPVPWRLAGPYIYSDAEQLWAEFQFKSPETTWPVQFAEYIRLRIIAETVDVYKPDANQSPLYERRADAKLAQVIDSTQQVEGPQAIFEHFQTTRSRLGDHLRPVQLNRSGQALP